MNEIKIQANETGIQLIKAVCDLALKKDGLKAFNAVSLLIANTKPIPPVVPPQETEKNPKEEK